MILNFFKSKKENITIDKSLAQQNKSDIGTFIMFTIVSILLLLISIGIFNALFTSPFHETLSEVYANLIFIFFMLWFIWIPVVFIVKKLCLYWYRLYKRIKN